MSRSRSVAGYAIREVILGPRGITKISAVWLPLSLILLSSPAAALRTNSRQALFVLLAVFCKVMFSIQVNDLSDRREDQAAGKRRWIPLLPESLGILVCTLTILVGSLIVVAASRSLSTISAYAATILLALFYSARPVRFKQRRILGPIVYAASATTVFVLVPWTWLSSNTLLLVFLCVAVGSDKWIQLHFHQVVDFQADRQSETRTFAVRLGLENARRALRAAALQVMFTGGEPLLRKDIFDLVAHAHHIGLLARISTNGYLLTRECVKRLKQAGLNQCGVSIDYADAEAHDRSRGLPGSYERVMRGLGYLREYGIDRKIISFGSHEKIPHEIERILELAERLKVNSVFFTIPYLSGRWSDSREEALSENEMARLRSALRHPLVDMEFPSSETMCSSCAKSYLYVNAVGEVTPCPAVPYAMGNVRQEPLAEIWRRHVARLRLESRGHCPMNSEADRKLLREHAASVLKRIE